MSKKFRTAVLATTLAAGFAVASTATPANAGVGSSPGVSGAGSDMRPWTVTHHVAPSR